MDIFVEGLLTGEETAHHLQNVFKFLLKNYQIEFFREISLKVTLLNEEKEDVELVDSITGQVYRVMDVNTHNFSLEQSHKKGPFLKLVVDNTHKIRE